MAHILHSALSPHSSGRRFGVGLVVTLLFGGALPELPAQVDSIPELRQFLPSPQQVAAGSAEGEAVNSSAPSSTQTSRLSSATLPAREERKVPGVTYANPGRWGTLRCFYIYIEAPKAMVDEYPLPSSKPRWTFPLAEVPRLPQLFREAGLPEAFSISLLEPLNTVKEGGLIHLFPSVENLEAMTPAMREVIYPELAKYPENEYYVDPVLITADSVDEWYATSKLRPELIGKIRQYSYKRGDCLAFSDLQAIMNYAQSDTEARAIFKAFTRTRSLMVQMELDETTNLEPLLDYWTIGLGIRRKDIEPIMQSIIDTEGVERLGLSHVLPALARKLLYTYPGPELLRHGMMPDCHWTSLNFFNYEPHEYLLDARLATSSVLEHFAPIEPPYRYGDILFFLDNEKGNAFHSCVYLADDIVFTKNGRNQLSPWILMKLEEVRRIYLYRDNGHIQGFRHKGATGRLANQ